jgi:hypothetical protein
MIQRLLQAVLLSLLIVIQVSFIDALPFPFDRIPLVLIVAVYLIQSSNGARGWLWLIGYGVILDLLHITMPVTELFSYFILAILLRVFAMHIITNRSVYGMGIASLIGLSVLTLTQTVLLLIFQHEHASLIPGMVLMNVWGMGWSIIVFLLLFPLARFLSQHIHARNERSL